MEDLLNRNPLVSVCVITYQHVNFIKECLEGILIQKTNFPFEIIIGEDESTDGTREICIEYAQKYPNKIRLFLRSRKNVIYFGGKPSGRYNLIETIKSSQAQYIALCEGDDYWTDENKLQKQVDFLQAHDTCNYVITKNMVLGKDGSLHSNFKDDFSLPSLFDLHYLLWDVYWVHKTYFWPATASIVYRRSALPNKLPDFFYTSPVGDRMLFFMINYKKNIGFINEYTTVYREATGVTRYRNDIDYEIGFHKMSIAADKQLNKYTNYEYDYYITHDWDYEKITYLHLENKQRVLGIYYFFFKITNVLFHRRYKISDFRKNNTMFIKHSIKLLFKSFFKNP